MTDLDGDAFLVASTNGKSNWILDSGNAYHLCKNKEMFSTYVVCDGGLVWMANNMANKVVGKGSVRFCMADRKSLTLTDVRHVPSLQKNLIFIGVLDSKRCSFETSGRTLRVFK